MNITPIKDWPLIPRWLMAWGTLLLIVFSLPPLAARLITLSGEETRAKFLGNKPYLQEDLNAYVLGRERAVSFFPFSGFYNDLAMVALDRAGKNPAQVQSYIENAFYWQHIALTKSPSDPYGWFRLAYIYESMNKEGLAAEAWKQSYISAPYEPRLLLPRLAMARRLEKYLGAEAPKLIRQLIQQSWDDNPWHLTRMARDDEFLDLAKEALEDDPEALIRFDKILKEQL